MDTLFERSLRRLLGYEGGYSNQKNDRGGKTNLGVTQSEYYKWQDDHPQRYPRGTHKPVTKITTDEAKQIYKANYWDAIHADKMPPDIAVVLFDTAVNSGVGGAQSLLTEALQMPRHSSWQALTDRLDQEQKQGKTQQVINNFLQARWHLDDVVLPKRRPGDVDFQTGWYRRLGMLRGYSSDVIKNVMYRTPGNNPLVLGNSSDYVPLVAKNGRFTFRGVHKTYTLPGKDGTYVMLDSRAHWPLMDDKGNVIVFDKPSDGYETVKGGAFVGTLDESGTKLAQPHPGLPVPGTAQHPGQPNQPPAARPVPSIPQLHGTNMHGNNVHAAVPSFPLTSDVVASNVGLNPAAPSVSSSGSSEAQTGRTTGFGEGPERYYAAIPQGFGRCSMLHRETHRYLPDMRGNRLYFNSPDEGYRAAAARLASGDGVQAGSGPAQSPAAQPPIPGFGQLSVRHPMDTSIKVATSAGAYPTPAVPGAPFAAGQTTG